MAYVIIFQMLFHFVDNPTTSLFHISRHLFKINVIITLQCFSFDKEVFNTIPDIHHTSYLNREVLKVYMHGVVAMAHDHVFCTHLFFLLFYFNILLIYFLGHIK